MWAHQAQLDVDYAVMGVQGQRSLMCGHSRAVRPNVCTRPFLRPRPCSEKPSPLTPLLKFTEPHHGHWLEGLPALRSGGCTGGRLGTAEASFLSMHASRQRGSLVNPPASPA